MRTADAAVGIMDSAYFVSKKELLDFFNTTLDMNLTKIEQTATGAVACQLCEMIFPKSIPVSRIDWGCRASFEYIANYKLLQAAFTKNRVRRHLDVDKLIRGKFQDNLEFCQWLKAFHDQQPPLRDGYDPAAVRAKGKGGRNLPPHFRPSKGATGIGGGITGSSISGSRPPLSLSSSSTPSRPPSAASTPRRASGITSTSTAKRSSSAGSGVRLPPASSRNSAGRTVPTSSSFPTSFSTMKENATPSTSNGGSTKGPSSAAAAETKAALVEANKKTSDLTSRVAELELMLQKTEQERDFYFEKLRGIESMVHSHDLGVNDVSAQTLVGRIGKVLDATVGGDIPVGEGGEFTGEDEEKNVAGGNSCSAPTVDNDSAMDTGSSAAEDLLKEVADINTDMDLSLIEA
eukprot:CAMPEP_0178482038 /NCGR_PEP_ID=MMETSP0696-20121128/6522_1 /TAXON_ID=265572 /ORGANISM="Extubocellulus spinifer, Strain CCMP396" /LENGTH=403 /DNA_ID=CAMNT_0020109531 /DNA_START=192 /DNA_END=1403 /DNA_ORIENTATION=-